MNYDLVVFDIAGTTVRDDGGAVGGCLIGAIASHTGITVATADANKVMGIAKPLAIAGLLRGAGREAAKERVAEIHADFVERMLAHYRGSDAVGPMPDAERVFASLRSAGVRVALDTGFDRRITDVVLDRLGWRAGVVDATITSDEVAVGRPAPYMIHRLMERLGVTDVRRVVKVGDTPSDLEEGTNAGCGRVIGITHGTHTAEQLRACPHTDLAADLNAVVSLLRS